MKQLSILLLLCVSASSFTSNVLSHPIPFESSSSSPSIPHSFGSTPTSIPTHIKRSIRLSKNETVTISVATLASLFSMLLFASLLYLLTRTTSRSRSSSSRTFSNEQKVSLSSFLSHRPRRTPKSKSKTRRIDKSLISAPRPLSFPTDSHTLPLRATVVEIPPAETEEVSSELQAREESASPASRAVEKENRNSLKVGVEAVRGVMRIFKDRFSASTGGGETAATTSTSGAVCDGVGRSEREEEEEAPPTSTPSRASEFGEQEELFGTLSKDDAQRRRRRRTRSSATSATSSAWSFVFLDPTRSSGSIERELEGERRKFSLSHLASFAIAGRGSMDAQDAASRRRYSFIPTSTTQIPFPRSTRPRASLSFSSSSNPYLPAPNTPPTLPLNLPKPFHVSYESTFATAKKRLGFPTSLKSEKSGASSPLTNSSAATSEAFTPPPVPPLPRPLPSFSRDGVKGERRYTMDTTRGVFRASSSKKLEMDHKRSRSALLDLNFGGGGGSELRAELDDFLRSEEKGKGKAREKEVYDHRKDDSGVGRSFIDMSVEENEFTLDPPQPLRIQTSVIEEEELLGGVTEALFARTRLDSELSSSRPSFTFSTSRVANNGDSPPFVSITLDESENDYQSSLADSSIRNGTIDSRRTSRSLGLSLSLASIRNMVMENSTASLSSTSSTPVSPPSRPPRSENRLVAQSSATVITPTPSTQSARSYFSAPTSPSTPIPPLSPSPSLVPPSPAFSLPLNSKFPPSLPPPPPRPPKSPIRGLSLPLTRSNSTATTFSPQPPSKKRSSISSLDLLGDSRTDAKVLAFVEDLPRARESVVMRESSESDEDVRQALGLIKSPGSPRVVPPTPTSFVAE